MAKKENIDLSKIRVEDVIHAQSEARRIWKAGIFSKIKDAGLFKSTLATILEDLYSAKIKLQNKLKNGYPYQSQEDMEKDIEAINDIRDNIEAYLKELKIAGDK